jgi:3-hydroxybutyryl-CoA dehydrogenase
VSEPRIAVFGAGLMGAGIAATCAAAGHEVAVHDPGEGALASARERIAGCLEAIGADPALAAEVACEARSQAAVEGAEWVFEAAPEDLALKQELFARLDAIAAPGSVLASNSSALRPTEIAARAERPERIVGTHFWNPAHLVPLVEVVRGERTAEETVTRTLELLSGLGKVAVRVERDVPGFVGNRLQHALWREAFALVDAGVCDAETVDLVVKNGFGPRLARLGPMENADLVGLDLTLSIHEYLLPRLEPPSEPATGLRERVAGGRLGMAAGEGWRRWPEGAAEETQAELSRHLRDGLRCNATGRR